MKKHWIANLLLLLTVNILIKPLWIFGIDRNVQNIAGTEQYGIYFATFNFTVLLYILLDMGIANYNARTIALKPDLLPIYWGNMLFLKALLAIVYILACTLGAWWLQYSPFQTQLLVYLAANQILIAYISYFRSNFQGLHHFRTDTWLSVLDRVSAILLCGILLYVSTKDNPINVLQYARLQTISYFLTALVAYYSLKRIIAAELPQNNAAQLKKTLAEYTTWGITQLELLRQIVRQTLPFALMVLLMSIYTRIDAVLLAKLLPDGAHQAGIYASAYRLLDALTMIGSLAATQLLPLFTRLYKQPTQLKPILKLSSFLALGGSLAVAAICWHYQQPIMNTLYRDATPYYAQVFAWLMWSFVPISTTYIFGTLLTAKGNMRLINWIVLAGMLLNLSLNCWLIPTYKALGAAWATLGAQTLIAIAFVMGNLLETKSLNTTTKTV
jgi:O-antigen/teichoic acid export membrane protein